METFSQLLDVTIKRVDESLPLPAYATPGSVGFDLLCRAFTEIAPRSLGRIPANVIVRTPPAYMLLSTLRSSTPRRKGLLVPHGVGITDPEYCGDGGEIMLKLSNFRYDLVTVERGRG